MSVNPEKILNRFLRTAYLRPGQSKEVGTVRIQRFAGSIVIWDLTHAGKRGKKVERLVIMAGNHLGSRRDEEGMLDRVASMIEGSGTFNRIKSTIQDYLRDHPNDLNLHNYFERGVDVTPAGFKKIEIKTPNIYLEADYDGFRIKDLKDPYNDPTCIPAAKGGKKSIPIFYRWVQDNLRAIERMTYGEILSAMKSAGIQSHNYCAVD